ncbi:MAG: hypothetical protein QXG01_00715 [Candidatus Bathyarchaeia archaeon]
MDEFKKAVLIVSQILDIPIVAFLGYFIFEAGGQNPTFGTLLGALVGTFLLWLILPATEGAFKLKRTE